MPPADTSVFSTDADLAEHWLGQLGWEHAVEALGTPDERGLFSLTVISGALEGLDVAAWARSGGFGCARMGRFWTPNGGSGVEIFHLWAPDWRQRDWPDELVIVRAVEGTAASDPDLARGVAEALCRARAEIDDRMADANHEFAQLTWIANASEAYTEDLDRIVNYVNLEPSVFELAEIIAKRLSEARLKWVRAEAAFENLVEPDPFATQVRDAEGVVLLQREADPEEEVYEDPPLSFWPFAHDWLEDGTRHVAGIRGRTLRNLEIGIDLARELTQEAGRRVDRSLNGTLFWIALLTLSVGVLTIFDRYLSNDTFGIPASKALWTTLALISPLVAVFLLAVVRSGTLSPTLGRLVRIAQVRFTSWSLSERAAKIPGLRRRARQSLGARWYTWVEWMLAKLMDRNLRFLEFAIPDTDEEWDRLEAVERQSFEWLDRLWTDLDVRKSIHLTSELSRPASSTASQAMRLRASVLVNLAFDSLWLELPKPCPSIPVYAVFAWEYPSLYDTYARRAWLRTADELSHRYFLLRYAQRHAGSTPARTVATRFRTATSQLILSKLDESERAGPDPWLGWCEYAFGGGVAEDPRVEQALAAVQEDDLWRAYGSLTQAALHRSAVAEAVPGPVDAGLG